MEGELTREVGKRGMEKEGTGDGWRRRRGGETTG